MNETELYFPGKPIAKHRPRFARRGKFVVTYSDQETEEGRFLWELKTQWKEPPMGGPIGIRVYFYMPIPASTPKKKVQVMVERDVPHMKKPDLDNLLKFIKDVFNGVVWHDDGQVSEIMAEKTYSNHPSTKVFVRVLDEMPPL